MNFFVKLNLYEGLAKNMTFYSSRKNWNWDNIIFMEGTQARQGEKRGSFGFHLFSQHFWTTAAAQKYLFYHLFLKVLTVRVTISPFGVSFTLELSLKNNLHSIPNFWATFSQKNVFWQKKMHGPNFGLFFYKIIRSPCM
jgi:hypothetical protein